VQRGGRNGKPQRGLVGEGSLWSDLGTTSAHPRVQQLPRSANRLRCVHHAPPPSVSSSSTAGEGQVN
jgi:hypothetical protein